MIRFGLLDRYFTKHYLLWFGVFLGGLTAIIYVFEVTELMRRAMDKKGVDLSTLLLMGALKLPETVERVMPFVVLFAGMFTFWQLTRRQELIIARASGVSAWQFMALPLAISFLFGFVSVVALDPIEARMNNHYKKLEQRYLKGRSELELSGAGLWLRQNFANHRYLLHADKVAMSPTTIQPVVIFEYDQKGNYIGRIDAPRATLGHYVWSLDKPWVNRPEMPVEQQATLDIPTDLTQSSIEESMAAPNTISFWALPTFIHALNTIGLPATRHEVRWHSLMAKPLLLCAMIFFAAGFSLRIDRRGKVLGIILSGAGVGIAVYTLNSVVVALGLNQTLPVVMSAWAIPVAAMTTATAILLHLEDG